MRDAGVEVVTPISFVVGESVCVEVGEEDFKNMLGKMESYMMGRWEEAPFRALCAEGFRGRQHLPVAAEIQKKIPTKPIEGPQVASKPVL